MKKTLISVFIVIILSMVSCNSVQSGDSKPDAESKAVEVKTGRYVMSVSDDEDPVLAPNLTLYKDKSFTFFYDTASSYSVKGHYKMEDDIIMAEDGNKKYLFQLLDETSIAFIADGSSDVSLIDERIGTPITDGAEFYLEEDDYDKKRTY